MTGDLEALCWHIRTHCGNAFHLCYCLLCAQEITRINCVVDQISGVQSIVYAPTSRPVAGVFVHDHAGRLQKPCCRCCAAVDVEVSVRVRVISSCELSLSLVSLVSDQRGISENKQRYVCAACCRTMPHDLLLCTKGSCEVWLA